MNKLILKEHYICYIDILGYETMIKQIGEQKFLQIINEVYKKTYAHWKIKLGLTKSNGGHQTIKNYIKVFSDNIVIAIPNKKDNNAILKYMIIMIGYLQAELIKTGILIRGSITSGMIYINRNYIFGSGLVHAYRLENEISIYPRIIVDRKLVVSSGQHILGGIEKDTDGYFFVDYLKFPYIQRPTQLGISEIPFDKYLQIHKTLIEIGIHFFNKDEKVLQKYLWCREYHNRFCSKANNFKKYII